jgi:hypothetical protein
MIFELFGFYWFEKRAGINILYIGGRALLNVVFDEEGLLSFHLLWIKIRG